MKKFLLLLCSFFMLLSSQSQNITGAEYFVDTDPGTGNGTVIPGIVAGDIVNFSAAVPTGSLSSGFHLLAIRVKDINGAWSLFERRGFYVSGTVIGPPNIITAEYFFDNDPGVGNGTVLPVGTPGAVVNFSPVIPQSLATGFHFLAIRVKDANGNWSLFERRGFYTTGTTPNLPNIAAAEYFFDSDPGVGNGTVLSVGTPGAVVNFSPVISQSLTTGFHFLVIRVKDANGNWSLFDRRGFYASGTAPDLPVITAAEFFYDTDPGRGNGTPLIVTTPGNIITQAFNVPVSATMTLGQHFLGIYIRDLSNNWSLFAYDTLSVEIKAPADVTVNTAPGLCSQVVNNIDPAVLGAQAFNYTLSGATTGSGNGSASGLSFNKGITTVTYTITASPTAFSSFTVTVVDNENPTISCPSNITMNTDAGICAALVNYSLPTFNDNCPGSTISRTAGPASGSSFPKGTTTVTYQVTDAAGHTASCSFTVTVVDAENPTINCPSNITVNTDAGTCAAVVNYSLPTFNDNCPGSTIARTAGPASGSSFPKGTTTVTYQVTDAAGNTVSCSFTVTVVDAENPTVNCPSNITVNTDAGTCAAIVNYNLPTFNDNCPGSTIARTAGPASGSSFPKGITTVTHQVTDAAGNTASCSFTVTVVDAENPTINCPSNMTVNTDAGTCAAIVNYSLPTFNDNCPGSTIARTAGPASGSSFPKGITTVTHQVTDAAGNTASCSFTVTVVDAENPTINCPADIVTTNPVVNYSLPIFNDNCGGTSISQSTGLPSGSTFPIGVTTNTFIVTDAAGNTASCSFNVTVNPSLPVHLISFTATKTTANKVLLEWVTENEVNNSHFEIQRSENGSDYVMIGRVNASTSSSDPKDYSFTDAQPLKGANYYRLRQVDRDGRFEYTPVRRIVFSQAGDRLTIYPNPANDYVQFDYAGNQKTILVTVFDAVGRQVLTRSLANQAPLKINISKLPNGNYWIVLNDGLQTFRADFLKQ